MGKARNAGQRVAEIQSTFRLQELLPSEDARTKYVEQITSLHQMLVYAMKAKQTTDLENVEKLRTLMETFEASYRVQ